MKTAHKVFLIIGLFFIAVCVFLAPRYYAAGRARQALEDGGSAMMSGDMARGAAQTRYALEQLKLANGSLDAATINAVRDTAANASAGNPAESLAALGLLHDYRIGLTCEQKQAVAGKLLGRAAGAHKQGSAALMGGPLYTAVLWLQGCAYGGALLAQYNSLLDGFATLHGGDFGMDSWLTKARNGETVDPAYTVPVLKKNDLEKMQAVGIPARAREFTASMQYSVTSLISAGASIHMPAMPSGKKAAPAKKQPAAAPAAKPRAATPATETPAPAAPEAAKPETSKPAPEKPVAEKPAPKKPEAPKPAPASGKQGALVSGMPPARDMTAAQAAAAVRDAIQAKGLNAPEAKITPTGKVLSVTIKTGTPTGKALAAEAAIILDACFTFAGTGEYGIQVSKIQTFVQNDSGDMRFKWEINMADYEKFRRGALTEKQFYGLWQVKKY